MLRDDFWLEKKTEKNFHYYFFNWVYWHPQFKKKPKRHKTKPRVSQIRMLKGVDEPQEKSIERAENR